jgi:hypothetical protein
VRRPNRAAPSDRRGASNDDLFINQNTELNNATAPPVFSVIGCPHRSIDSYTAGYRILPRFLTDLTGGPRSSARYGQRGTDLGAHV